MAMPVRHNADTLSRTEAQLINSAIKVWKNGTSRSLASSGSERRRFRLARETLISTNTTFRILAVLFILLACQLGRRSFMLIVWTLGFAHYALGLLYSR